MQQSSNAHSSPLSNLVVVVSGLMLASLPICPAIASTVVKEAEIYQIRNQVDINYRDRQNWSPAEVGDKIIPRDSVRTGANSRADILFNEGTLVRTGAGTVFRFPPGKRRFELTSGAALIMIRPEQGQSTIQTPQAKIVSQGTALFVQHNPQNNASLVGVLTESPAGLVKVKSANGEVTLQLQAGQFVSIVQGVVGLVEHFVLPMFYETAELSAGLGQTPKEMEDIIADESPEFPTLENIDGIIYCPGTINLRPFKGLKLKQFQNDMEINFFGAVKTIQQYQKQLIDASQILLFSTVAVQTGMAYHASIAAAKGAVEGLTRSLAAEFAPKTAVNCIAPSVLDTQLAAQLLNNEQKRENAANRHPLKRIGTVEDISKLAKTLVMENLWITGQIFHIDGGMNSIKLL